MNKLFYPAVFHKAEEGGFWVSFPDFPECFTEGDDITQAYEMAVEALGLALVNRKEEKKVFFSVLSLTTFTFFLLVAPPPNILGDYLWC